MLADRRVVLDDDDMGCVPDFGPEAEPVRPPRRRDLAARVYYNDGFREAF